MSPRLPCLPLIAGLVLAMAGCDSVNRAFEYASRPSDDPAASEQAALERAALERAALEQAASERAEVERNAPRPTTLAASDAIQASSGTAQAPPVDRTVRAPADPTLPAAAFAPVLPIVAVEPPDTRPPGEAGLALGVREGYLREARRSDRNEWLASQKPGDAPTGSSSSLDLLNAYVVLKPYRLPSGLYGAHSARFYVPRGVERPTGELGHSSIYDFNTRTCAGATCNLD